MSFLSFLPAIAHNTKEMVYELRELNENLSTLHERMDSQHEILLDRVSVDTEEESFTDTYGGEP